MRMEKLIRQMLNKLMDNVKIRRERKECEEGILALRAVVPESPEGGWLVDEKGTILNPPFEIPVRQYRDEETAQKASAAIRTELSLIDTADPDLFMGAEEFLRALSSKVEDQSACR